MVGGFPLVLTSMSGRSCHWRDDIRVYYYIRVYYICLYFPLFSLAETMQWDPEYIAYFLSQNHISGMFLNLETCLKYAKHIDSMLLKIEI